METSTRQNGEMYATFSISQSRWEAPLPRVVRLGGREHRRGRRGEGEEEEA